MAEEMQTHNVAVVVIAQSPGVDARDAAHRVRAALGLLLSEHHPLYDSGPRGTGAAIPVLKIMEVGAAARNGYLQVAVTGQAAHEQAVTS